MPRRDIGAFWAFIPNHDRRPAEQTLLRTSAGTPGRHPPAGIVDAAEFSAAGIGDYNSDGKDAILFRNSAGILLQLGHERHGDPVGRRGALGRPELQGRHPALGRGVVDRTQRAQGPDCCGQHVSCSLMHSERVPGCATGGTSWTKQTPSRVVLSYSGDCSVLGAWGDRYGSADPKQAQRPLISTSVGMQMVAGLCAGRQRGCHADSDVRFLKDR